MVTWPVPLWLHGAPPIDPAALEQHLDAVVGARLRETGVPGVVVAVVQDDRVLLAKGWGLADLAAGVPMDGTHTRTRTSPLTTY